MITTLGYFLTWDNFPVLIAVRHAARFLASGSVTFPTLERSDLSWRVSFASRAVTASTPIA
jgi:hypothetical protein